MSDNLWKTYMLVLAGVIIVTLIVALAFSWSDHDGAGKVIAIAAVAVGALTGIALPRGK